MLGGNNVLNAKWRKRGLWIAGVAAVLLAVGIYRFRGASFQWDLFLSTFYRIDWRWLLVSMLLMLLTYVGRALRWEVMLRPLGKKLSIRKLTSDTAIGFTAVVLLGRPGELVRPYLISKSADVPFSSQMAAWLLERILDLLVVLLLFGFGLTRIPTHGLALGPGLQWVLSVGGYLVAGIGAACVLFLVLFRNFGEAGQRRILGAVTFLPEKHFQRVERTLAAFSEGMESTKNLGFLGLLLLYTVIEWAIIVGSYYTLFRSFPATSQLMITDVVVFLGFVAFGSIVQIPGIGGGIQVTSIVVLTQIYGLPFEAATGVALFIWIVTFVVVVPFGFVCAFHEGINWSKLKHLPEDVPL
ncbi:MAG TPA: lysylphosphatidylglycerol synthase transmembrane domain-containing protein [Bryobacteraceae bacterium]|nr:lysylphosphatidylglycerol synthase transmembrane domain-containing protein [Bryobacteraceae bacterium]